MLSKATLLLLALALARAEDEFADADAVEAEPEVFSVPSTDGALFAETFQTDPFGSSRWAKTNVDKYAGQPVKIDAGSLPGIYAEDQGMILAEAAKHYGIAAKFPSNLAAGSADSIVVQYEVRMQEGLECGGAYVKVLKDDAKLDTTQLKDDTEYIIMFGPDKCGATNKVHFILRYENPVTHEFEEKHLKNPPSPRTDKKSHLYTLLINKDNTYKIMIDQTMEKKGSLLEDLEPPINPEKEIDDPEDKKPEDWVDTKKIGDPDASKPDDWDEDALETIDDEAASKPSGWLDDAPAVIADPAAKKPGDWDDEEDGEWEAPQVPNPACTSGPGCGEWKRPVIKNPAYKGKWHAPMIDNPAYKGEWAPKKIENPGFFEEKDPFSQITPMAGIAVEVWTMTAGLQFDNFFIGNDADAADAFGKATWAKKNAAEKAVEEEAMKGMASKDRESKRKAGGIQNMIEVTILDGMDWAIENMMVAGVTMVALIFALIWMCTGGQEPVEEEEEQVIGKKKEKAAAKGEKKKAKKEAEEDEEDEAEDEDAGGDGSDEEVKGGARKRRTQKAD
jgi:calnexin